MTASMDNRRQPENSEVEQPEQRESETRLGNSDRLRPYHRRNRRKERLEQEVTPSGPQPSEASLRRGRGRSRSSVNEARRTPVTRNLATPLTKRQEVQEPGVASPQAQRLLRRRASAAQTPMRSKAMPLKPVANQQTGLQPTSRTRPPLRPDAEINYQRPKPRTVGGVSLPQNADSGRGRNRGSLPETPVTQGLKLLTNFRNRRRQQNPSRIAGAVPVTPAQGGATDTRRFRQGTASASSQSQRNQTARRPQKRSLNPLVYIVRLLILGIGIGAIAGTLLSALDPTSHASVKVKDTAKSQIQASPTPASQSTPLSLSQEILPLKAQMQALVAKTPALQPGVFIVDLDTGAYLNWDGGSTFAAASTIKVPILVAFFQDVDAGKIRLDEPLTLNPEMIAAGSGELQYKKPGTQFTALEVATKMIAISDNTATNMLLARLGGTEALNQRFRSWGLTATVLHNSLPDLEGTNTTSPEEQAKLMSLVNQGELVSLRSRDRLLDIMQQTETNSLLPKGLGPGATIAHKTGTIGSLLADVGVVDMPTGKRYIVAVMVKRPHDDASAQELIRQISRTAYDYFNQPRATPSTTSMPVGSTATVSTAIASDD